MVGIFDSGVGGLTVVREIKKIVPDQSVLYFGDTARVPWGNKSPEIVRRYCEEVCSFIANKGINEIVIACNTASAVATEYLEKRFADIKFYNVIDPCVDAVGGKKIKRVGVVGTRTTIASGIYNRKIKELGEGGKVYSQECPLFVPLVEEGWEEKEVSFQIANEYLKDLKTKKLDALILGCTHYPLLESVISKVVGSEVRIVSSAKEVAKKIAENAKKQDGKTKDAFCFSDVGLNCKEVAKRILQKKIVMRKVQV